MTPSISYEVFSTTLAIAGICLHGIVSAPFHSEAYEATQWEIKI